MTSNTNNSNTDTTDLDVIDSDITKHRRRAILLIILVGVLYLYLGDKNLPESAQSWGTFGDFVGGILNPIFALFAFYWLTYSVRLQVKELKDTRQELQKAAEAQKETSKHQEKIAELEEINVKTQNKILELQQENLNRQNIALEVQKDTAEQQQVQIAIQNFESLFFQLLNTKNYALNDIYSQDESLNSNEQKEIKGKDAIKRDVQRFKSYEYDKNWETFYKNNLLFFWGSYFRICYQIVKLIDENNYLKHENSNNLINSNSTSEIQKKYFDIFRSTLTQYELEAFFFNCLCNYGAPKFKNLLTKYGLFEPLLIDYDRPGESIHRLTRYAFKYEFQAFEENSIWSTYFKDLEKIPLDLCPQLIIATLTNLNDFLFIKRRAASYSSSDTVYRKSPIAYQFSDELNTIPLSEFSIHSNIRNFKRLKGSLFTKDLEKINDLRLDILNSKKYIEIINNSDESKNNKDILFKVNRNSNHFTSINIEEERIANYFTSIDKHRKQIYENKIKLDMLVKNPLTPLILLLIKYSIHYQEYQEYMISKISNPE